MKEKKEIKKELLTKRGENPENQDYDGFFIAELIGSRHWGIVSPRVIETAFSYYYRVINLNWQKVLSFCCYVHYLTNLEAPVSWSTMFDVFCVQIS